MDIITKYDLKYTYSGITDKETFNRNKLNTDQELDVLYIIYKYFQKHGITEIKYIKRIEEILRKIITIESYEEIERFIDENLVID